MTVKPVHLEVTLKPGIWIDPSRFIKQIADAGYAARKNDIRITLTGKVSKDGDGFLLTVDDLKPEAVQFRLVEGMSKDPKVTGTWNAAFKTVTAAAGQTLEIEGFWTPSNKKKQPNGLPSLSVIRAVAVKADRTGQ